MDRFGKYQVLYNLSDKLNKRYLSIPYYSTIKRQLWNLFATDLSPGLILITEYYSIEMCNKNEKYKHDKLKQANWLLKKNNILPYLKNPVMIIRKIRNLLVHSGRMTMIDLNECVICMLELNSIKEVVGKQMIELILDGLLSICKYLDDPKDKCLSCPLCKNMINELIEYPQTTEAVTILSDVFSVRKYSLKIIRDTMLKSRLKSRQIEIKSGKHTNKVVTLKSWSGTSVKITTIDNMEISIPVTTLVCIPDELTHYLMNIIE
jgi:hypothetical protein